MVFFKTTLELDDLLTLSATHHHKICPRQVLGVRIGLLAGHLLDLPLPQSDKRILAISETDGCFVDGVSAATGCYVGRRTLRIEDYGKIAVTFVDTFTEQAIRIRPKISARERHGTMPTPPATNGKHSSSVINTSLMNYCFVGNE